MTTRHPCRHRSTRDEGFPFSGSSTLHGRGRRNRGTAGVGQDGVIVEDLLLSIKVGREIVFGRPVTRPALRRRWVGRVCRPVGRVG